MPDEVCCVIVAGDSWIAAASAERRTMPTGKRNRAFLAIINFL